VLATGGVKCWGASDFGVLGDGASGDTSTPVAVGGISDAIAIAVGGSHACALLSAGTVRCWGANNRGQLGNGSADESSPAPVGVTGISDATAISGSFDQTCALLSTGQMRCWGYNDEGQIGDGTTDDAFTPVPVQTINDATAIAAGASHTCAVLATGRYECWGSNGSGQLGNGTIDRGEGVRDS
jgi:hypothetical protein